MEPDAGHATSEAADDRPAAASRTRTVRAALTSALLAMAVAAGATALRGRYPFGAESRNTNDLAQQFIPMYAYARDVVTGQAHGNLVFSWQSGFGTPFLGDALAYVGTVFPWIAVLLPRNLIDLSLFLVYLACIGTAAALMTVLLRRLRPTGPVWLAVLAGAAYGASAWPIETGYMTTWLNGVVAFPALCLVADVVASRWSLRSVLIAPWVVALLWTMHFYTVYMATIGAAVFVLARALAATTRPVRDRVVGVVRAGLVVATGIALAAPLLVPVQRLVSGATPSAPAVFDPASGRVFLTRLLPATAGVAATPALGVGLLLLVLALAAPFNARMPRPERLVWPATVLLVLVSMQVPVTHLVWHAFDTPNGNPYRQAFVAGGFIVILGWLSGSVRPRAVAVGAGAGLVGLVLVLTLGTPDRSTLTTPVTVVGVLVLTLGLLASSRSGGRRATTAIVLVLGLATLAELTISAVVIDARRSEVLHAGAVWGPLHDRARALVASADEWPTARTDPGTTTTVNDPMLIGGEGSEYYSSTIQNDLTETLADLGWGYSSYGRALVDPADPVTDAIFTVRSRLEPVAPFATNATLARRTPDELELLTRPDVAPLVTVGNSTAGGASTVWERRGVLLGGRLYEVPDATLDVPAGVSRAPKPDGSTVLTAASPGAVAHLRATCTPGSRVYLSSPALVGEYEVDGRWLVALRPNATRPGVYTALPVRSAGTSEGGAVDVPLRMTTRVMRVGAAPLACLPPGALESAVAAQDARAATDISVDSQSISFTVPQGPPGRTAVVAVPRLAGWTCSGAVRSETPGDLEGLLAVAVSDGGRVTCSYTPPGSRLGLALGGLALLLWAGLVLGARRWGRATAATAGPSGPGVAAPGVE
ncbi:MAG TPA: YfhO family protein [Phycicoccus sp.]|nr:YfhO family protein [Phycicoccus sp.]